MYEWMYVYMHVCRQTLGSVYMSTLGMHECMSAYVTRQILESVTKQIVWSVTRQIVMNMEGAFLLCCHLMDGSGPHCPNMVGV